MNLAESILEGNRLALARALSWVENDTPQGSEVLTALFAHTGRAHIIGITGSPGTGKSSLVNQLARHFRKSPHNPPQVAIIAVDPTSPFTGGAILRRRMLT
jgi:LAO/AO transport system kinase